MIYFYFLGAIYLLILTYQDIKHKMLVDDRLNYFMMGVTVTLYYYYHHNIFYILILVILVNALAWLMKQKELMGSADNKTMIWCFLGLGIINRNALIFFLITFLVIQMIYSTINAIWFKQPKIPGYPIFLISFILTWWMF